MAFHQFGRAYSVKGDIDASRQAYDQQLALAEQVNDQSQIALAHRGIAGGLMFRENYPGALPHLETSLSIYRKLDNHLYTGNRLIDYGDMLWRLGRYKEARAAFEEATSIADLPSIRSKQLLDSLRLVEAQMELSARQPVQALESAKLALGLNAKNEHAVQARYMIGRAQALLGAKREAMRTCILAVQEARHTVYPPILSGALLALAETMIENNEASSAYGNALEALARFEAAGQHESEWQALLLAGRAAAATGDSMKAREYAARAEAVLSTLQHLWGMEAYNGWLARPDVAYRRSHLSQILNATN